MKTHVSVHSHRVDKMSGLTKQLKPFYNSVGRAVIKRSANAKRRRFLKNHLK
jgi:hypothetical protein